MTHHDKKLKKHDRKPSVWCSNSTPGHLCCSRQHGFPQLGSTLPPWAKHTATIKKLAPQLNSRTPLLFAPTCLSPAGLHTEALGQARSYDQKTGSTSQHTFAVRTDMAFPLGSTQKPWAKHTATIKKLAPQLNTPLLFAPTWLSPAGLHTHALGQAHSYDQKTTSTTQHIFAVRTDMAFPLGSTPSPWAKHRATIKKLAPQLNSWTPLLFAQTWLSPVGLHTHRSLGQAHSYDQKTGSTTQLLDALPVMAAQKHR